MVRLWFKNYSDAAVLLVYNDVTRVFDDWIWNSVAPQIALAAQN